MNKIEKDGMEFEVSIEGTREYYCTKKPLEGMEISNFEKQVKSAAPLLDEYLKEFGVDISKPDELCWCWQDEKEVVHYNVAYTICGKIKRATQYEVILQDKSNLHLVLETEYVPNQQKETYFAFTVYNIEMPWSMEESYPRRVEAAKNSENGLIKKILKILKKY